MKRLTSPPYWILWLLLGIVALSNTADAAVKKRLALVIGNGRYENSPLANPVNDASDIAQSLKATGFEVILETNADRRRMDRAIREFGRRLREGGVGLFYFAGHGLQIDGRNYLIPVGAVIEGESDVRYEAVDAGFVLGKMEDAANGLNIIILDACRDNPFARSFRSSEKGLAKMDAPVGSILAYATAPGSVASDGGGRNGLYTSKLLKYLPEKGLKIEDLFKQVRREVLAESGGAQVPWESSSLAGDFYFSQAEPMADVAAPPAPVIGPSSEEQSRLVALEAERARLEAERARLEAEKQFLVEKQRIEAEKHEMQLELERLKTQQAGEAERLRLQLEMERLKSEQASRGTERQAAEAQKATTPVGPEKPPAAQPAPLASLPPQPNVVSTRDGGPLKLALFAVRGSHNINANWGDRQMSEVITRLANLTASLLIDSKEIAFAYSCLPSGIYRQEGWVRRNVKIIDEDLSGDVGRQLWYRPSLFADWQPAVEQVLAQARRLGADLVLMYRFYLNPGAASPFEIFLIDVASGRVNREAVSMQSSSTDDVKSVLKEMLNKIAKAISSEAQQG